MESSAKNPRLADKADRDFHLELLRACGNETLQLFSAVIHGLFSDSNRSKYWKVDLIKAAARDHRDIIEAIRREETAQALDILVRHRR